MRNGATNFAKRFAFGTDHLSLYQLTIEPATPFFTLHKTGALKIPDEDRAAELYEITQEMTQAAGRPAYEISNHARPGSEARHNLLYWRYGAYAGVGPGAHGRLDLGGKRFATQTERLPERWRETVARDGHGLIEQSEIAPADAAHEHLLMNLRLAEGIDLAAYRARWGTAPDTARIASLVEDGLVTLDGDRLTATPRGRLLLNSVIAELATCFTSRREVEMRRFWGGANAGAIPPPEKHLRCARYFSTSPPGRVKRSVTIPASRTSSARDRPPGNPPASRPPPPGRVPPCRPPRSGRCRRRRRSRWDRPAPRA